MNRIGIVGSGAWGTALAIVAARAGRDVLLWAREPEVVDAVNADHANPVFLPGVALPESVTATGEMADLAVCEAILLVAPAQFMRPVTEELRPHLAANAPVVICAKGIEQETGKLMSEVVAETMPDTPLAILSGPTFAGEVAEGLPGAVTLAAHPPHGDALVEAIGLPSFRPYLSDDIVGAQIGGALKNVFAIAAGIALGKKLGDSARAALITRGMAEILRFGQAKGADEHTLMGLSGLGDLILTAGSLQSRNTSLGKALGEGRALDEVLGERRSVSEGVYTAAALARIAAEMNIDMPIAAAMNRVLHQSSPIDDEIDGLLHRPFTPEFP